MKQIKHIEKMKINKIYNENCLDTMSRMDDGFIDLTVTSPPYDNLRTYNDKIDETWGEHVWKPIIKELYRVTKDGGVVVWVVGDATINGSETGSSFRQALYAMDCGFNLHDTMIYVKNNPIPLTHNRYEQQFEYMFVFSKGSPTTFNPKTLQTKTFMVNKNYSQRNSASSIKEKGAIRNRNEIVTTKKIKQAFNIWYYDIGFNKSTKDTISFEHPATFPEKLAYDHIISWSNKNNLVYDPFMGSGTTAKVAICSNRNWIGSEISKEYCDIANKRLEPLLNNLFT
jgi:DNA modification methylase